MSKEKKVADRFLVQVPDDLKSISELPLANRIAKIKVRSCGAPPRGNLVEETKLIDAYGLKAKKLLVPQTEYFVIGSKTIEEPDIALLTKTYEEKGLNPTITAMQIHDGADAKIVWRHGYDKLTAIARNGKILTEEEAVKLSKEVGGHVCLAEVIEKELKFPIIRCVKT